MRKKLRKDLLTCVILAFVLPIMVAVVSFPIYLTNTPLNAMLILMVVGMVIGGFLAFMLFSSLQRQYFGLLDFFEGLVGLEVYGSGVGKLVPLDVQEGKIIHPSLGEIGTYDTENAVISLNLGNPESIQLKVADSLFRIAGKPFVIIDGVNKYILNRKLLSYVESQIENFATTIARLSNLMIEKATALEPALAVKMTRGGRIMNFLTAHGKEIALILLVIFIGLTIFYYVFSMGERGTLPQMTQIWGGR